MVDGIAMNFSPYKTGGNMIEENLAVEEYKRLAKAILLQAKEDAEMSFNMQTKDGRKQWRAREDAILWFQEENRESYWGFGFIADFLKINPEATRKAIGL